MSTLLIGFLTALAMAGADSALTAVKGDLANVSETRIEELLNNSFTSGQIEPLSAGQQLRWLHQPPMTYERIHGGLQ